MYDTYSSFFKHLARDATDELATVKINMSKGLKQTVLQHQYHWAVFPHSYMSYFQGWMVVQQRGRHYRSHAVARSLGRSHHFLRRRPLRSPIARTVIARFARRRVNSSSHALILAMHVF